MKALSARPIKQEKNLWYKYNGRKALTVKDRKGLSFQLKKGDLFGVYNLSNRLDRVVLPSQPNTRYILAVETVSAIIDASKRHREAVEFAPTPVKPQKVKKIRIPVESPKEKAKRLEAIKKAVKRVKDTPKKKKVVKPKITKIDVSKKHVVEDFDLDEDTFTDENNDDLLGYL